MIRSYLNFLKEDGRHSHYTEDPYTFEIKCESCGKTFTCINRDFSGAYKAIKKHKNILCLDCRRKIGSSKGWHAAKDLINKGRAEKSLKLQKQFKQIEEEEINHRIKSIEELKKWYEEKHRATTCICEHCGREIPLKNRRDMRTFLKWHPEKILCKGCGISLAKIEKNKEKILNSEKITDCTFILEQPYFGANFEAKKAERKKYEFICKSCGRKFKACIPFSKEKVLACPDCYNPKTSTSSIEIEIYEFIKNIYKGKIERQNREILSPRELDLYFPDLKLAIEVDGYYWHNDSLRTFEKYKDCNKLGIRLISIYDIEWKENKEFTKAFLKAQLGLYDKEINSENCELKEITSNESKNFLSENYFFNFSEDIIKGETINLGLFFKEELIQLVIFNKQKSNWELSCICSKKDLNILKGKEKLLKSFIEKYSNNIIAYCDLRFFSEDSYKELGFKKIKSEDPSYRYVKNDKIYQAQVFEESELIEPSKSKYFKIYDFGKILFKFDPDFT